jgi:hypothetical protein
MKRLLIQMAGNQGKPFKIKIRPGTKAGDILAHLKLGERYVLSPVSNPTKVFSAEDDVYAQVMDREKLETRFSTEAADKYILSWLKKKGEL